MPRVLGKAGGEPNGGVEEYGADIMAVGEVPERAHGCGEEALA